MTGEFQLSGGGSMTSAAAIDTWTDLADFTDSLRNMLARPGTFDDLFPETTDTHLVQVLRDGLAEAHLEGLLTEHESDDAGLVRVPLATGESALVVLMGGARLVRSELMNRATSTRYVAGPVSAETTYATNILRDIMKALEAQKLRLVNVLSSTVGASAFEMADSYVTNAWPIGIPMPVPGWA